MSLLRRICGNDRVRAAAMAAAGTLFSPYSFESYYVPLIMKSAEPGLFPRDLFVNSMGVYNSAYFAIIGFAARHMDLHLLSALLYAAIIAATAVLIFELAMELLGSRKAAYLAVFLLLVPKCAVSVAFAGISRGAAEPSTFAGVFLLLAILFFIRGRRRIACLIVSCTFYVQGMEAAIVAGMFLWHFAAERKELPLREAAISVSLLLVPALPIMFNVLGRGFLGGAVTPEATAQWLAVLHVRSWFHLFPFSWGPGDWFNYSGWFILIFLVFRYGRAVRPVIKHFLLAVAAMCAASTFFSELVPVPVAIKMVLWRSTIYFLIFLLIYTADYLAAALDRVPRIKLLASCSAAAIFLAQYKLIVCFGLLHLAAELGRNKTPARAAGIAGAAGLVLFAAGTVLSPALPAGRLYSFIDIGAVSALLFTALAGLLYVFAAYARLRVPAAAVMVGIGAAAFVSGWSPAGSRPDPAFSADWRDVQVWAEKNTPHDALFITPPYLEGFRIYSRRATVLEMKDGAPAIYDAGYALAWWRRVNDFGYTKLSVNPSMGKEIETLYRGMDAGALRALSGRFGAGYIVLEKDCPGGLGALYRNRLFSVCSASGERG